MSREGYDRGSPVRGVGSLWRSLARVRDQMLPPPAERWGLLLLTVLAAAAPLLFPYILGKTFDLALGGAAGGADVSERLAVLGAGALLLLVVELAVGGLFAGQSYYVRRAAQRGMYRLRAEIFSRLLRVPLAYHDGRMAGELASRVRDETEVLEVAFFRGAAALVLAPVGFLGMALVMFLVHPRLAVWTLLPIPILAAVTWVFVTKLRGVTPEYRESVAAWGAFLHERLQAVELVRRFGRMDAEARTFDEKGRRSRDLRLQIESQTALLLSLGSVSMFLGTVVILWAGGSEVIRGTATVGQLVTFLGYLAYFYAPLSEMSRANYLLQNAAISAERILEVLDQVEEDAKGGRPLPEDGAPAAEAVSFAYPGGGPALHGASLALRRGVWVALAGPTGCGKSTMVALLAGLRRPQAGRVRWGDVDLAEADEAQLRRDLAVVSQEDDLLDGALRENVLYGDPDAATEDLDRAAGVAGLEVLFAAHPRKWETQVGERGKNLSGGERQRVCLARALLRRPRALILDEATSALDEASEADLLRRLRRDDPRRAVLLVSHRPSVLRAADEVVRWDTPARSG